MNLARQNQQKSLLWNYLFFSVVTHLVILFLFTYFFSFDSSRSIPKTEIAWIALGTPEGNPTQTGLPTAPIPETPLHQPEAPASAEKKEPAHQPPFHKNPEPPAAKKEPAKKPKKKEAQSSSINNKKSSPTDSKKDKKTQKNSSSSSPQNDAIANALNKNANALKKEGSLSQGGQGSPDGHASGSNSECAQYSSRVKQKILGNWKRLASGNKPPRPPVVLVRVSNAGQVTSAVWKQRSGDDSLDHSAMSAVQNSSPFPTPPHDCQDALQSGFVIQFGR